MNVTSCFVIVDDVHTEENSPLYTPSKRPQGVFKGICKRLRGLFDINSEFCICLCVHWPHIFTFRWYSYECYYLSGLWSFRLHLPSHSKWRLWQTEADREPPSHSEETHRGFKTVWKVIDDSLLRHSENLCVIIWLVSLILMLIITDPTSPKLLHQG